MSGMGLTKKTLSVKILKSMFASTKLMMRVANFVCLDKLSSKFSGQLFVKAMCT